MNNINDLKANQTYNNHFLKFPKAFLYSEKYRGMSSNAKVVYLALKERLKYSAKNNWIDKHGEHYIVFTNKELMDLLNKSETTIIRIKKELIMRGLLKQIKRGTTFEAQKKGANRLYLYDVDEITYN